MLQLPGSGVLWIGVAVLLAGASCSAPDSSGLFGPAPPTPIRNDAPSPDDTVDPEAGDDDASGDPPAATPTNPDTELPGVSNGEGPPISGGLAPPETSNSGEGTGAPVSLPADAGVPLDESAPDAGAEPAEPEPAEPEPSEPAEPESPGPAECDGAFAAGNCWYVGARGQSCNDVCATRGGVAPASAGIVGTPDQGGSIEGCDAVVQALGGPAGVVNEGFREDGLGFGCHVFIDDEGTASAWWLTSPEPSATIADPNVQLLCGCAR